MKSRGLVGATAAAACIEGSSGEGIFVAGVSDGCLRVYSVSFCSSAQAHLPAKVAFTELVFLSGPDGSEAHVMRRPFRQEDLLADRHSRGCQKA